MSFLDRFAACAAPALDDFPPFVVAGATVGHVVPAFARALAGFPDVFTVSARAVTLSDRLATFAARTRAVEEVLRTLAGRGDVRGWRDEPYPVVTGWGAAPLLNLERAAVPLMGVRAYGVHVNGLVRDGDEARMWVARRSPRKTIAPGKLDQIVAGGQPAGLTPADNVVKEADEEAGIPAALARRARPVGAITYTTLRAEGLRRDALFLYDLDLPPDFAPHPRDGEVEEFLLWDLDRVRATARDTDDFKFNCSLVAIDFLIRHGRIGPDDPEYLDIATALRR